MKFTKYELDWIEASRDKIESLDILNDAEINCVELDKETSIEQKISLSIAHLLKDLPISLLIEDFEEVFPPGDITSEESNIYLKINNKVISQGIFETTSTSELIKAFTLHLIVVVKVSREIAEDVLSRATVERI